MSTQRTDALRLPVTAYPATPLAWPHERVRRRPVTAFGLLGFGAGTGLVVEAYAMARTSTTTTHFTVFWAGFALVLLAATGLGVRADASRWVRVSTLVAYGAVTFLPKLLMSWSHPVYFDEFGHLRHVNDMLASGRLDVATAYQPISRYYPGLEVVTAGVQRVTHLSTWHAGQLVVVLAHTAALFAVWRLAVALGLPERLGFLAALIYSLNPSFLYFDTQFAYESLGLPLAFCAVTCAVIARRSRSGRRAAVWGTMASLLAAAVIPTHHISAAVCAVMLIAVTVFVPSQPGRPARIAAEAAPWVATGIAVVGFVLWSTWVAPSTVDYLKPHIDGAISQGVALIRQHGGAGDAAVVRHTPFATSGVPTYERLCAFAAQGVAVLVTLAALVQAWRERRRAQRSLPFVPCLLLSVVYFASLPLALTGAGGESAHRVWAFSYLGIALVAVWGLPMWASIGRGAGRRVLVAGGVAAMLAVAVGSAAAGENVYYRFPGPYAFGTDTRSQTPELRALARWADEHVPARTKVVTDRFTAEVLTGSTRLVTQSPDESYANTLYREGDDASTNLRGYLAAHHFRYWFVDMRILTTAPVQRFFQGYTGPDSVSTAAVASAGSTPFLRLVRATAHYRVYEITP